MKTVNHVEKSCTLAIKAVPNAPRHEVVGWLGEALKVKIHAPPVEGRANEALCEFLADELGLPRRAVTVLRGDTSRLKLVRIAGLTLAEAWARLVRSETALL
ncbi:MAG: DUF167 domain-containing protein [Verrucomicrobia bacterium]|nr:DUF167 domain-containing protein [Verrucomicrobiota bacterium]